MGVMSNAFASFGFTGGAAAAAALVIHTLEAVRMSERRALRPWLIEAGAVCLAIGLSFGGLVSGRIVPVLDRGMFPVAAAASSGLGAYYGHGIHGLLKQRAIPRKWRAWFSLATGLELTVAFLDIWLTTAALVIGA